MPIELQHEFLVLCEGAADQTLVRRLIETRGTIPAFDIQESHGVDRFHEKLTAIKGAGRGFSRIRGILILADSTDDPAALFRRVQDQIEVVGGYPVPTALSVVAPRTGDHPAVMVTLLPDDATRGCLETLYVSEILARHPWAERCLDEFLRCDRIAAHGWPAEKRDKARFGALVAALHDDDPSRAASKVFWDKAVIDVKAACFDALAARLAAFCAAV